MRIKSRTLYVEKEKEVTRHSFATNRRFLARTRACSGDNFRILVKYTDEKKEYPLPPYNDSGWYKNKKKLLQTAQAFLNEADEKQKEID